MYNRPWPMAKKKLLTPAKHGDKCLGGPFKFLVSKHSPGFLFSSQALRSKALKALGTLHSCSKEAVYCLGGMGNKKIVFYKTLGGFRKVVGAVGEHEIPVTL